MSVTYSLTEGEISDEESESRKGYGIMGKSADGETASFPDVFTDRGRAEDLVRRCNEGELRLCHLLDVIYDTLN